MKSQSTIPDASRGAGSKPLIAAAWNSEQPHTEITTSGIARPTTTSDPLFDENEASHYIHVARPTMRNWRSKGIGPRFVKIGKRLVRYKKSSLDEFIAEGDPTTWAHDREVLA